MKKLGSGGQGAVYLVDILSTPFTSASDTDREATACDQVYGKEGDEILPEMDILTKLRKRYPRFCQQQTSTEFSMANGLR
jgi:hypothetical protein